MRPIDADALYDKAEMWYKGAPTQFRKIYRNFVDAVADAPTITTPTNDPLTLEELRETDGDKIYVHYINGFYTDEDGAYFGKFEQLVRECNGKLTVCEVPLEYYGKTWLAYTPRYPESKRKPGTMFRT